MENFYKYKMINGVNILLTSEEIEEMNFLEFQHKKKKEEELLNKYKFDRINNYKSPAEYLDMLWHSMEKGEIPKSIEFFEHIKDVKEKFPKKQAI